MENYIMVLIKVVNEDCDQRKLFYLVPSVRYCGLVTRLKVSWPCKYLSMNHHYKKTMFFSLMKFN